MSDSTGLIFQNHADQSSNPLTATASVSTPFSSAAANATLTTQLGNTSNWFGFGTANSLLSTPGTGSVFADAGFFVVFDVLAPIEYSFRANFDGQTSPTGGAPPNRGFANWGFALSRGSAGLFGENGTGAATRSFTGLLDPARYTLNISTVQELEVAASDGFGRGAFSFALDMTPVAATPEPASLLLLGTGVAGLLGWRKRSTPR